MVQILVQCFVSGEETRFDVSPSVICASINGVTNDRSGGIEMFSVTETLARLFKVRKIRSFV